MLAKRFHESTRLTAKHGACGSPRPSSPRLNVPPLAVWPMLGRQAGHPFATRRGIPVDRGRNRFSFRRRFPCFRCISICRREASPLSRPPNCMLNPSEPLEGRNGQGEGLARCGLRRRALEAYICSGASRLDHCLFSQSSTLLRAASLVMPARS